MKPPCSTLPTLMYYGARKVCLFIGNTPPQGGAGWEAGRNPHETPPPSSQPGTKAMGIKPSTPIEL